MSFHCVVLVREVWDTRDLSGSLLDESGALRDGALVTRMEPEDLNALETALRIKDEHGGKVTAVSMGAPAEVDALRECLYRGTDEAVRIAADPAALDTQARADLFAAAIRKLDKVDLVLAGVTIAEGENSLLGSHVAANLDMEQASYVDAVESLTAERVVAKRAIEMGYEDVELPLPALLSVGVALVEDDPRTPRSAKAMLKLKAKKTPIPEQTAADLAPEGRAPEVLVRPAGMAAVPEKTIDSVDVDPEDEEALRSMLETVLKGD